VKTLPYLIKVGFEDCWEKIIFDKNGVLTLLGKKNFWRIIKKDVDDRLNFCKGKPRGMNSRIVTKNLNKDFLIR
jgi:hypothetical protein